MKKLIHFDDYLLDMIFENKKELPVLFSYRLLKILRDIDHPVSNDLLAMTDSSVKNKEATLIDYDDNDKRKFTYMIPSKIYDFVEKNKHLPLDDDSSKDYYSFYKFTMSYKPDLWTIKQRPSTSIGKVVNKLLPNKYTTQKSEGGEKVRNYIEEFTNLVVSERDKIDAIFDRFRIVEGDELIKYYLEKNYDNTSKGTLQGSCMRYDRCSKYMEFYINGGVKMVILMSENNPTKITGRALLWDISEIDGEEVNRKFMDRVYTNSDSYFLTFQQYAEKNNWLYKYRQNNSENEDTIDPENGERKYRVLVTQSVFEKSEYYPYLDTLKYFYNEDGYLSNNNNLGDNIKLEDTDGGPINTDYEDEEGIWSDYYNRRINEDDLVWCEYGEDYRLEHDAIYLEWYDLHATQQYVDRHMVWSDHLEEYIHSEDAIYSEYHESDIPIEDSVRVYLPGASDNDYDEIYNNDKYMDYVLNRSKYLNKFIKYILTTVEYFSEDDKHNFVECKSLEHGGTRILNAHKEWDKDRIFRWNGEYWLKNVSEEIYDEFVGQTRLKFDDEKN